MIQSKLPFKPVKDVLSIENVQTLKDTLNIWTWNINCIKNKIKLVQDLLIKHDIDILLLTETKIQNESNIVFDHYHIIFNSNKTSYYHGIAFVYKKHLNMSVISTILPNYGIASVKETKNNQVIKQYLPSIEADIKKAHNTEGRILVLKCDFNHHEIILVGTYVPNSGVHKNQPFKRLGYRTLAWDKDLYHYLNILKSEHQHVIWTGDLNVTIKDNDLLNVKSNIAGTTPEERDNIKEFMIDWIDTWDMMNEQPKCQKRATWGVGKFPLRLDYVICSQSLKDHIVSSIVDQDCSGSDHVPVGTQFKMIKKMIK